MPHADGIATIQALHTVCPHVAVIMLSIHDDAMTQALARRAGAAAFVPKSIPADMLLATIRQAVAR